MENKIMNNSQLVMTHKLVLVFGLLMATSLTFAQEENKVQKIKNAFQSDQFQLFGYGQVVYSATEHSVQGGTNNSIDIPRAILFATGKLGKNNQFGYMLMYDFGPNSRLHELYGEWLPSKAVNLRFGQYKIPFTIENPLSPTRIETINFSRSASAMSGSAGDFNQFEADGRVVVKAGRDAGLQLSGLLFPKDDFHRLEYYAGLFNGTGMNAKDNNNHKDFIGTAYFQPVKGLKFGGSIYSGKLYRSMNNLPAENHTRDRWTVGAEYNDRLFYGRSEYIAANDGGLKRRGAYGSFVWKFIPRQWEALVKYDFYDSNIRLDKNEISDITAGVNYYFAPVNRIQLNYVYSNDKTNGKNNTFLAQLQLFF
jgi:hypothetical protein